MIALLSTEPLTERKDWSAEVEAVAKKGGVPPKQLRFIDGTVRFRASETMTFDQVKCVSEEFKARGVSTMQGYIGAGRLPPTSGHDQGSYAIPKAVLRLCLRSGKFLPFSKRPQIGRQ